MPPPQQQPAQNRNQSNNAFSDVLRSSTELARQGAETLGNVKDTRDVATSMAEIGKLIVSGNQSVLKLDAAVSKLEKAAPGTVDTVDKLSSTLAMAADKIDPTYVPNGLKGVHQDLKDATKEFQEFSNAYKNYQETKGLSKWNPLNWSKKADAGTEVLKEWQDFKASWDKLQTHVPPVVKDLMNDPLIKKTMNEMKNAAINALEDALDPVL